MTTIPVLTVNEIVRVYEAVPQVPKKSKAPYLRVELDLAQIELRLRDEEPAERVLGQQLDDEAQVVRFGVVLHAVLDGDGEDVAEDALAGVAARLDREVDDGDGGGVGQVLVVVSEHRLQPLFGDGPVGGAARLFFALGHGAAVYGMVEVRLKRRRLCDGGGGKGVGGIDRRRTSGGKFDWPDVRA